jgi:large subunit ribosomal protein L15
MRLHDLKPASGSHRDRKRIGRGNASGQGTTAGKGTKGERARSGGMKAGFRGMSSRNARMAKRRGFTNIFKTQYEVLNVKDLAAFGAGTRLDPAALQAAGLVEKTANVKILGDGELTVPVHLSGVKFSASARQKIEAAGGTVTEAATVAGGAVAETATRAGTSVETEAPAGTVAETVAPAGAGTDALTEEGGDASGSA